MRLSCPRSRVGATVAIRHRDSFVAVVVTGAGRTAGRRRVQAIHQNAIDGRKVGQTRQRLACGAAVDAKISPIAGGCGWMAPMMHPTGLIWWTPVDTGGCGWMAPMIGRSLKIGFSGLVNRIV